MADRVLRDHSTPCIHEGQEPRTKPGGAYQDPGQPRKKPIRGTKPKAWWNCSVTWCPGGREVTIDAICDEIWSLGQASWPWRDAPTPAHDAALGVTDERDHPEHGGYRYRGDCDLCLAESDTGPHDEPLDV